MSCTTSGEVCPCGTVTFPQIICNAPGLSTFPYRIGDYLAFRHSLLQALPGETELVVWRPGATGDLVAAITEADVGIPLAAVVLNQAESVRLLPRGRMSEEDGGQVPAYGYPEAAVAAMARAASYGAWRSAPRGDVPDFADIRAAEARTLATQIRESEERKAELVIMQARGEIIKSTLQYLELEVNQLETEILWLDATVRYRQKIEPLRQIMEALVLPDITGLEALQNQVFYAEQAAEAHAYTRWLSKPIATLSSVAATWGEAKTLWAEIGAVEAAVEAGKHVVSTDRLKSALGDVEATFGQAVRLWRGIRYAEDLSALLGDITDSAEQLAGVEIELAAAQAELMKGSCPKCGKPVEHTCV